MSRQLLIGEAATEVPAGEMKEIGVLEANHNAAGGTGPPRWDIAAPAGLQRIVPSVR